MPRLETPAQIVGFYMAVIAVSIAFYGLAILLLR